VYNVLKIKVAVWLSW